MHCKRLLSFISIFALLFGQFASVLHAVGHLDTEHGNSHAKPSAETVFRPASINAAVSGAATHYKKLSHGAALHTAMPGNVHSHAVAQPGSTLQPGATLQPESTLQPGSTLTGCKDRFAGSQAVSAFNLRLSSDSHQESSTGVNCLAFHLHGGGQALLNEIAPIGRCLNAGKPCAEHQDVGSAYPEFRPVCIRGPPLNSISSPM